MPVLILNGREVETLLPMGECIEVVERALAALARGEALQPLRQALWLPDRRGLLGLMPGHAPSVLQETATSGGAGGALGLKVVTVFPGNHPTPGASGPALPSHQGVVMLFDADRGNPVAILDAASITAIRTAAASAVATRLLAREDAAELALLGSGVQASTHLEAMRAVRPISRVRVWSRTPEHARAFVEKEAGKHDLSLEVTATAREAVAGADVVATVTGASEPVLEGAWLAPGAHVNAVGACTPKARELDTEAVVRSRLFVDRRESALHEAGDFLFPRAEGAIGDDHIQGEIGDLILGRIPGRRSPTEITLFKSLGLAVEDLAAAEHVVAQAEARGVGTRVEI